MDHTNQAVLAQVQVDGKSNEITTFQPLLDRGHRRYESAACKR